MNTKIAPILPVTVEPVLNPCSKAIIKTLLYYDIFHYPLQEDEISNFLSIAVEGSIRQELDYLHQNQLINRYQEFYFIGATNELVNRRIKGNQEAERYLKIVSKHVHLLSVLPFIKCICISGSLSKKYMDEKSDIDYFIITDINRLWVFRAILTIICKLLWVLRSNKYLCPNYIITENTLEIQDKNIYTAIEIATLIPVYNPISYINFINTNLWIKNYFPNLKLDNRFLNSYPLRERKLNKEWINRLLTTLDESFYRLYKSHYQNKFNDLAGLNLAITDLNFNRDIFKMHLSGHRNKILEKYKENMLNYKKEYGIDLHS